MSFWDNVKKFAQPYSDDEYDDYDDDEVEGYEEEAAESRATRRTSSFSAFSDTTDFNVPVSSASTSGSSSASASSSSFSGQVVNMNLGGRQEVFLFHAKTFDDAARAADELRGKKAVILNMENIDKALTRRVVDFLSGCVYSLDGKVKKVAQSTYLFCPHSMEIVGDLESFQTEIESYI